MFYINSDCFQVLSCVYFPFILESRWCGPCKMLTPRLEVALGGKGDQIDLAKVDVDSQENLAAQYKVI